LGIIFEFDAIVHRWVGETGMRIGVLAAAMTLVMMRVLSADAADVTLISADPMAGAIKELRTQFERDTGHRLIAEFVSGPMVKTKIDAGATFDVAISVTPVIEALSEEGRLVAGSRTDVARVGVGLGVHAGAPKPDIGSVDAFKRALLAAKSVAYSADGVGG